jgi:hypothetical protein
MLKFKAYPGQDAPIFIPSSLTLLAWILTFLLHFRIQVVSRTGCATNHSFFARTFALDISRMVLFSSWHVGIQDISRTGSAFLWDLLRMDFGRNLWALAALSAICSSYLSPRPFLACCSAMPVIAITAAEATAAMALGASALRYIMDDLAVRAAVQAVVYHRGFNTIYRFVGIGETKTSVRQAAEQLFGLKGSDGIQERRDLADLVNVWENAKIQNAKILELRAEAAMINQEIQGHFIAIFQVQCVRRAQAEADNLLRHEETCYICHEFARIPFANCYFCGEAPSYHHGRCCSARNLDTAFEERASDASLITARATGNKTPRPKKAQKAPKGSTKKTEGSTKTPGCKKFNMELKSVTPGGQEICYKFGRKSSKCDGSCGRFHVCQVCLKSDHGFESCPTYLAAGMKN